MGLKGLFVNISEWKGLIVISRNIQGILKRCRGLFKIKYMWWEGLFAKRKTGRAFLGKRVTRVVVL